MEFESVLKEGENFKGEHYIRKILEESSTKLNQINSRIKSDKRGYWLRKNNFLKRLEYEEQVKAAKEAIVAKDGYSYVVRSISSILAQDYQVNLFKQDIKKKVYLHRHKKIKMSMSGRN